MSRRNRLFGSTLALAAFLAFSAADASAQMCIGAPGSAGQNVLSGALGFPSGANIFGVGFDHHLPTSPWTVRGTYEHVSQDGGGSQNHFGARAAFDLTGRIEGFPQELGFCALAGLKFGRVTGLNVWEIPVGVAFGGAFDVGEGGEIVLMPYAAPAVYHTRRSAGDLIPSRSSTDLDMVIGVTAVFSGFHVGLAIEQLFRGTGDFAAFGATSSYVTLRAGFTL